DLQAGALPSDPRPLAEAYQAGDWGTLAQRLTALPPPQRLCGAEINSVASMIDRRYPPADCRPYFFHSATPGRRHISGILRAYFQARGHSPVEVVEVADLQDENPKRFRTRGLRNLVRGLCRVVREHSAAACAINATGGYKAQIAVAVLLGQALGIDVYY